MHSHASDTYLHYLHVVISISLDCEESINSLEYASNSGDRNGVVVAVTVGRIDGNGNKSFVKKIVHRVQSKSSSKISRNLPSDFNSCGNGNVAVIWLY